MGGGRANHRAGAQVRVKLSRVMTALRGNALLTGLRHHHVFTSCRYEMAQAAAEGAKDTTACS